MLMWLVSHLLKKKENKLFKGWIDKAENISFVNPFGIFTFSVECGIQLIKGYTV